LADRLVDALRRSHAPGLDLAIALAGMLTLGARDARRFREPARAACREAVEHFALASEARVDCDDAPHAGNDPWVIAALASAEVSRRLQALLDSAGRLN